jgi:hypothetical protein
MMLIFITKIEIEICTPSLCDVADMASKTHEELTRIDVQGHGSRAPSAQAEVFEQFYIMLKPELFKGLDVIFKYFETVGQVEIFSQKTIFIKNI